MKLKEIRDFFTDYGLFKIIGQNNDFEWLTQTIGQEMDLDYFLRWSGDKEITSYLEKMIEKYPDDYLSRIRPIILINFKDKWNRLYKAFVESVYNPIDNYAMKETEKINSKITTESDSGSSIYAFNSDVASPSGDVTGSSTTSGSKDDNVRELERSGNIGVTTSAQMIDQEIKLRDWNFTEQIYKDLDEFFCQKIY